MNEQYYSRQSLNFILYDVLDVLSLTKHPYFAGHDAQSYSMVLDTAAGIAEKTMRPFIKERDGQQPELIHGEVKVDKAIREYYKVFCDSGLMSACLDEKFGGQQLPKTVYAAADFMLGNAHNGFEMFTGLSQGGIRLITSFASEDLIHEFVPKIVKGEYAATMCLTETQAGSSLSDIATEAFPLQKGVYRSDSYRIKGQKIFISAGDHDITENIVHLVLARISGAPKGVKGISLFIVPKKRKNAAGYLVSNDVASISLQHKMGQRSTPAMHLEFGANNDCIGHLIGEAGKGLSYMFQMMNAARLGVGLAGTYIASAAYYASLQYAKERLQGRSLNNKNVNEPQIPIIHHPDVRRMMLLQKAFVEGSLGFILQCYKYVDLEKVSNGEDKQRYTDILELLTPVAKTYGAEMGIRSVNNGLQVLGGYGYTKDFILEQLARDVRIMSLYEGTTGIQSLALLGRQIPMNNSKALEYWKTEVTVDIHAAQKNHNLKYYGDMLLHGMEEFEVVTKHLLGVAARGNAEVFLCDATLYMDLFGCLNVAWQWLKQGIVAQNKLTDNGIAAGDLLFYKSKLHTMKFFFHYELPKIIGLCKRLTETEVFTVFDGEELII